MTWDGHHDVNDDSDDDDANNDSEDNDSDNDSDDGDPSERLLCPIKLSLNVKLEIKIEAEWSS